MEQTPNPLLVKYRYAANYICTWACTSPSSTFGHRFPQGGFLRLFRCWAGWAYPSFAYFWSSIIAIRPRRLYALRSGLEFRALDVCICLVDNGVVHYLHFELIQPDYIKDNYNQALIILEQMNYPQEQLDALIDFGVPTSIQFVFSYIWFYIIGGALLFLILSPFAVRKDILEN